jgi:hypothetical protein
MISSDEKKDELSNTVHEFPNSCPKSSYLYCTMKPIAIGPMRCVTFDTLQGSSLAYIYTRICILYRWSRKGVRNINSGQIAYSCLKQHYILKTYAIAYIHTYWHRTCFLYLLVELQLSRTRNELKNDWKCFFFLFLLGLEPNFRPSHLASYCKYKNPIIRNLLADDGIEKIIINVIIIETHTAS